ncbi:ParB/RepB/Spo0J family partition protein [Geothrix fuzhouensis]|uniref:ParB/RepB/Spo0J family partition protein n=1 Tax=Geothrix fuzhouensis TaxID=2966451 RepID=UPI0021484D39|nr:ParB/RepB/Spo0J family partition protein [Geothrix fuzhouensis]
MTTVQIVSIDKIRVINARGRSKGKFREIVENIAKIGLKKPITVSRREGEDGFDLVCGQGRLEAYIAYGAREIPAVVVDIPLEDRLLCSLVENLTRRTPSCLELARDLAGLRERGHSLSAIAAITGVSESYVVQLIRLIENGEDRLVAAVERGDIPITSAIEIATFDDAGMQRSLQDAYDSGKLRGRSLVKMRRLIEERRAHGKDLGRSSSRRSKAPSQQDLVRTLRKETQKQELLVKKSRHCEQQLRFVLTALKDLMKNDHFVTLLRAEKLDALPKYLNEMLQK